MNADRIQEILEKEGIEVVDQEVDKNFIVLIYEFLRDIGANLTINNIVRTYKFLKDCFKLLK